MVQERTEGSKNTLQRNQQEMKVHKKPERNTSVKLLKNELDSGYHNTLGLRRLISAKEETALNPPTA